jgi:hypothetical protein
MNTLASVGHVSPVTSRVVAIISRGELQYICPFDADSALTFGRLGLKRG